MGAEILQPRRDRAAGRRLLGGRFGVVHVAAGLWGLSRGRYCQQRRGKGAENGREEADLHGKAP
jgi:hypothetical protein